ncbi:hypothetical protein T492DRAFT_929440 [Pavlovales sp. CCMP2436]|nr:hypothetical protein T492DRAFT_929440 [Pavlovales sp. CCMP2436]|eukprot:CAMPEP_0179882316 /NCGR_PEP_ID=MMETSP0982-20121206/28076_1 /TAXON_ID=483367 /ORGANISM="non described non described, Strain CCMP 2436" /LENGTH=275 /DNA_ID=CAMNT_0021776609 /DNA_START=52 /DNA_END=879 /DNA_ORIENTATION=-
MAMNGTPGARVCVYASSSAQTPPAFLAAAARLGSLLATGGHICVNGGGRAGGMGALNAAVASGGGDILGVIHKRWVVDECEFSVESAGKGSRMLIVDGDDLTSRKRGLRDSCDAIIVLPGGPGTWDELFELVALRQLGMSTLPICLVNTDGYYDGFLIQFRRAQADSVLKVAPETLVPAFVTVDEALAWSLRQVANGPCTMLAEAAAASRMSYRGDASDGASSAAAAVGVPVTSSTLRRFANSIDGRWVSTHVAVGAGALAFGLALGAGLAQARA